MLDELFYLDPMAALGLSIIIILILFAGVYSLWAE